VAAEGGDHRGLVATRLLVADEPEIR